MFLHSRTTYAGGRKNHLPTAAVATHTPKLDPKAIEAWVETIQKSNEPLTVAAICNLLEKVLRFPKKLFKEVERLLIAEAFSVAGKQVLLPVLGSGRVGVGA